MRVLFIAIFSFSLLSFSKQGDELESIDRLMDVTERQLKTQKELKELVVLFQGQQDAFFNGNQTKEHASQMVSTASHILNIIETHKYQNLFSLLFMQELEMFSSIANKNSPARP